MGFDKTNSLLVQKLPPLLTLVDAEKSQRVIHPGCYVVSAGTAAGKTITSLAFAEWCGAQPGITSRYLYINEPRVVGGHAIMGKQGWEDQEKELMKLTKHVIIVDSFMAVLFAQLGGAQSIPALKGGYAPAYGEFLVQLNQKCVASGNALFFVINEDKFAAADLEASVEGSLSIKSPGRIAIRDRDPRRFTMLSIPQTHLDAAAMTLFGEKFKLQSATWII